MRAASVFFAAAIGLAMASPAHAIKRYNIANMACAKVQAIVRDDGAAILRYPSKRNPGMTLYDRYVRDSFYCSFSEYAARAFVPAKDDKTCAVRKCEPVIILRPRHRNNNPL